MGSCFSNGQILASKLVSISSIKINYEDYSINSNNSMEQYTQRQIMIKRTFSMASSDIDEGGEASVSEILSQSNYIYQIIDSLDNSV
ncbi:hypothetical protein SS50377_20452 [Spironucleus salmonicida]|uniref:Uncharacterized protein n=1 Tax=Spironucleus salmonicida TaxID=348837 RepID=A0A9P8S1U8_9EUKA|nr:hypothetical protein SS50377_20452 [Spironucleus salmonicida]